MNYTADLTKAEMQLLINKYLEYKVPSNSNYTLFRAKIKGVNITIYTTNKLLIQGNSLSKDICNDINSVINQKIVFKGDTLETISVGASYIGNDEVGTGDFFGPVVVCSCYLDKSKLLKMRHMGVKDSKLLNDAKIMLLAPKIAKECKYAVTILAPENYNKICKTCNMNKIKAILHNNVMNKIIKKYPELNNTNIVLDQFCSPDKYYEYLTFQNDVLKNIRFETKGESKFLSIACASILARYYFVKSMDNLGKKYGYTLPKGAGSKVDKVAAQIMLDDKQEILNNVIKTNFKNYKKAYAIYLSNKK